MTDELKELNASIEADSKGTFPFIGENVVIKLEKGFHKAVKRGYYGVTLVTNEEGEAEALLYGYYWIPDNIVIYRGNPLNASENKQKMIENLQRKGYALHSNLPSLTTYKYAKDSDEFEIAMDNFEYFKARKR